MNRVLVALVAVVVFLPAQLIADPFSPVGSLDLGRPGDDPVATGGFSYDSLTNTYSVSGGGSDWWDGGEYGHFVYQPISGDFWFEGSVNWIGTSAGSGLPGNWGDMDFWAKAGLVVRNTLDVGAGSEREVNYFMAHLHPDRNEAAFQGRQQRNGSMFNHQSGGVPGQPVMVALNRWTDPEGDVLVQGFVDKGAGWEQAGPSYWAWDISHDAYLGLAVTAHQNDGRLDTADFANLQVLPAVTPAVLPRKPGQVVTTPETLSPVMGGWSVLEVLDNGDMNSVGDALRSLQDGGGFRHQYNRMGAINIKDGDGDAANFPGDGNYGVVDAGLRANDTLDHLAMLARGKVLVPESDYWSFYIRSDDGEELTVGNRQMVIGSETWNADVFGSVYLEAGVHDIQVIHREAVGGADVEVAAARGQTTNLADFRLIGSGAAGYSYTIPGFNSTVQIETTVPDLSPNPGNRDEALAAIEAGRLAGTNLTGSADRVYHADWETNRGGPYGDRLRFPNDQDGRDENNFAFSAEGQLLIPEDGIWYLGYDSDDGAALWIEGANWMSIVENATGAGVIDGE